jgi:elongation factor G
MLTPEMPLTSNSYIEPIPEEEKLEKDFVDGTVGTNIPIQFKPAIQKGYLEAVEKGPQIGVPVTKVRMVITDGAAHAVDSNEISFRTASVYGFREGFKNAGPVILEPIMTVEITAPAEFQGTVMGGLNKRKGLIQSTDTANDVVTVIAEVPLNNMFGYSSDLRSCTQGKGEFVMEYTRHHPVPREDTQKLIIEFAKKKQ